MNGIHIPQLGERFPRKNPSDKGVEIREIPESCSRASQAETTTLLHSFMYWFKAFLMASSIAVAGISNLTLNSTAAQAETYDALCGDSGCSINVDGRGISGPGGFIPSELV